MGDTALTIPTINPNIDATGRFQFMNQPMLSQYLESEYSIFGPTYNVPIGTSPSIMPTMGMGIGLGTGAGMMPGMGMMYPGMMNGQYIDQYVQNMARLNDAQYDIMENSSDRQTQFAFKQNGNQYVLNTGSSVLKNQLRSIKASIDNNDMRVAGDTFDRICKTIEKQVGVELKTHEERVAARESIRAAVADYYEQVNGTSLRGDINYSGDGAFMNGFKKGASLGFYNQNTAEQTRSYMTGDAIQNENGKYVGSIIGGGFGGAATGIGVATTGVAIASIFKGAKWGAKAGIKGALIGAGIGLVVGMITSAISGKTRGELDRTTDY